MSESPVETRLKHKNGTGIDVILDTSEITFGEKTGYTIIIKDISVHKKIEDEFGQKIEKYQTLMDSIKIGLFRTTLGRNNKPVEVNSSTLEILGFSNQEELFDTNIFDFITSKGDEKSLLKTLLDSGEVKNSIVQIRKKDSSLAMVSISAVLVHDESGKPVYCDGILEDVTDRVRLSEERENLIV